MVKNLIIGWLIWMIIQSIIIIYDLESNQEIVDKHYDIWKKRALTCEWEINLTK